MNRNASKIVRIKSILDKSNKFMEMSVDERVEALESFILSLPKGSYLIHTEGREAKHLPTVVYEKMGIHASLMIDKSFMRMMACNHPKNISVQFTHGLDLVEIS